jgi:hypothetical protein
VLTSSSTPRHAAPRSSIGRPRVSSATGARSSTSPAPRPSHPSSPRAANARHHGRWRCDRPGASPCRPRHRRLVGFLDRWATQPRGVTRARPGANGHGTPDRPVNGNIEVTMKTADVRPRPRPGSPRPGPWT